MQVADLARVITVQAVHLGQGLPVVGGAVHLCAAPQRDALGRQRIEGQPRAAMACLRWRYGSAMTTLVASGSAQLSRFSSRLSATGGLAGSGRR